MPRRIRQKPSLLTPAGSLLRRLAKSDVRFRRRALRISLWVLGLVFVGSLTFGNYSIGRIVRLSIKKSALTESNRKLTGDLVDAVRIRQLLTSDPSYIEMIARTKYFMVRPNETIYRYRGR